MSKIFDIEKNDVISDEENYYFFRALEPGDIEDLEKGIIKNGEKYIRIRTDRERWQEKHQEKSRWNENSKITLEEMFNHIKIHYSLQTNCISLSSNANVAKTYSQTFSDKYVMIQVPKKEMDEKVFHAAQYMLDEIKKVVEERISKGKIPNKVLEDLKRIDNAKTSNEIKELVKIKYKTTQKLNKTNARPVKGITYRSPYARISSLQSLNEEQNLEKNKIIAKLTILEHKKLLEPLMTHSSNNNLLIRTVGGAFSSSEQIYYGDIEGDRVIDISKETLDMFGLLQQVKEQDKKIVDELKREFVQFVIDGKEIDVSENKENYFKRDISIEEMYELTGGRVEYGQANSIIKNLFYLAKGQVEARELAEKLRKITNNNPKYEKIIAYITENGFEVEPEISTRINNNGYKLSEAVNLKLKQNEIELVEQIKKFSKEELLEIIQNGGLSDIKGIITSNFSKIKSEQKISKDRYYAEAIFSMYDWKKVGIEEFSAMERESLIQKIQEKDCINLYKKLEQDKIEKNDIPKVLLNIITGKKEELDEEISIERIERFLGYYDIKNTGIQLRPYQQRTVENMDEILKNNRFASVILPTGGGKSFVALNQLLKCKDDKILYLAPQNEILEQIKYYIVKYVHGPVNTLGKNKDEIVAQVFPNLKFGTYHSLLTKEELLKEQYGFIVLDELHRTGATEWGDKLNILLDNQPETTKVLGITATPRRDVDGKNMANKIAERLGYTNKDAVNGKHIAMNMSLTNAIRMGILVNPQLVSCAYTLKIDGSTERVKDKINQIEDVKVKNTKLEQYEKLIRKLDEAEGISEILQKNIKKGGKYLVFLPMIEKIEDEDGNIIGRKKGIDKILDYEKQIVEYFEGSDITPKFHSMLGEYSDKKNEKSLEEFQSINNNDTEFMLVINKANEGLHLENLDGIIWLRPMDENSRILYLQQLGRAIYAEDPDNPTEDENRPVVIDLVNNTLKVKWRDEATEEDDIELMKLVIDWSQKHDGILPNINSNDKEETGYAKVLKEIQSKYNQYLDNNLENLSNEKIQEIKEILELGSEIDLWQIEIPDRIIKDKKEHTKSLGEKVFESFELTGVLKDFINLENEVDYEFNTVENFIKTLENLRKQGVDISKLVQRDTIETLAKKSKIILEEEQLKKLGIELTDKIGITKTSIIQAYRGKGTSIPPTKEQLKKLLELGIVLDKKNVTQEFIEALENLREQGVDISKLTSKDTIETLAKKSKIILEEEQLKKLGIELTDKIGNTKDRIIQAYRGRGKSIPPTKEQVEQLLELGIKLELKSITGKEIAKATISSIKNIELSDEEDKALQELVKEQKKEEQK